MQAPEQETPKFLDYYHVTKLKKIRDIRKLGLIVSSGIGAGGSSADSGEAYKYTEQDKDLLYLWSHIGYSHTFVDEDQWEDYALVIVRVPLEFATKHIKAKGEEVGSTFVCDFTVDSSCLYYKKSIDSPVIPLSKWSQFDLILDKADESIWTGEGCADMEDNPKF